MNFGSLRLYVGGRIYLGEGGRANEDFQKLRVDLARGGRRGNGSIFKGSKHRGMIFSNLSKW